MRELLTRTEINVNHTNFVGWTPLLEAIVLNDGGAKQQEIVKLLLEHGANPHMTDKYGKSPLTLAREKAITKLLNCWLPPALNRGEMPSHSRNGSALQRYRRRWRSPPEAKWAGRTGFSRAVNLFVPEQNMLYTLLSDEYDNAPNSCRIALRHCDQIFSPGDRVEFSQGGIEIGKHCWVDFSHCDIWQQPDLYLTDKTGHLLTGYNGENALINRLHPVIRCLITVAIIYFIGKWPGYYNCIVMRYFWLYGAMKIPTRPYIPSLVWELA